MTLKILLKMKSFLKACREFFESNITSYTYLFFAQVMISSGKDYIYNSLINNSKNNFFNTYNNTINILISLIIPILFIFAAAVTFKFHKTSKWGKITLLIINYSILSILTVSALNTYK